MSGTDPWIDLRPDHLDIVQDVLRRHVPTHKVVAFGSRATWKAKDYSDLDLALIGDTSIPFATSSALAEAFSESDLPFKVDLVDWEEIDEAFREIVRRDAVVLQRRENRLGAALCGEGVADGRLPLTPLRLGNVCTKIGSGATPRGGKDVYLGTGEVALIRSQNIYNDRFERSGLVFIGLKHADQLSNVEVRSGDVLLNITGDSVARVCQAPEDVLPARVNQHVAIIRPDARRLDPRFLRFFLASPQMQTEMLALAAAGATRNALTKGMIEEFDVPGLSLEVQYKIAHILGALDDKIDLNRRMNETLEAMAMAIFKDWFVDFGPTRAKMEGRDPYLPPELWDLFPDTLDGEGKPVGWETFTLAELAHHQRATVSPSAESEQTFEHYSIPAYDAGNEPTLDLGGSIKSNKTVVPEGAVLLSKLNPEIERVWLPNPKGELPQITSTEFLAFTPLGDATRTVLFCMFKSEAFRAEMAAMVTGTSNSHQRVSPKALLTCEVLTANPKQLAAFDEMIRPFLDQLVANRNEAQTLARTRDLLLPKLMSGEVSLRDVEKATEAVA